MYDSVQIKRLFERKMIMEILIMLPIMFTIFIPMLVVFVIYAGMIALIIWFIIHFFKIQKERNQLIREISERMGSNNSSDISDISNIMDEQDEGLSEEEKSDDGEQESHEVTVDEEMIGENEHESNDEVVQDIGVETKRSSEETAKLEEEQREESAEDHGEVESKDE